MCSNTDKTKKQLLEEIVKLQNTIKHLTLKLEEAQIEAEKSNKIKSMFLSNISHEIRTPMNGIIGIYNVFKQTKLTEDQNSFLEIINTSAQNLNSLINDILDLSKIESGNIILENRKFNISNEIEKVIDSMQNISNIKGIKIITDFDNIIINNNVFGDTERFKQILTNLINNAIKYTKLGSVTVNTQVIKEDDKRIYIKFRIIDTGIGITKENQKNLFQSFYQIDSSSTRNYGGSGIGLAISKQLVNLLGGEIGVESTFGKGSEFWFTLAFEKA